MKKFIKSIVLFLLCILVLTSCNDSFIKNKSNNSPQEAISIINKKGTSIETRFLPPEGFKRTYVKSGSFGEYLRKFPLKPHGTPVKYYNGKVKKNLNIYEAVLDIDVGDRDLQQCADAVMRLRGEYLYSKKQYNDIHFKFVDGFNALYSKWMEGYRINVGNTTSWVKKASPSTDYKSFRKYIDMVFSYSGTASLHKELKSVSIKDMQIGDVFIQTGTPYGHAIIVVDMAENNKGEKLFMVAQSHMPAQNVQVLCNRNNLEISPWYNLNSDNIISTPQWKFTNKDLKRF